MAGGGAGEQFRSRPVPFRSCHQQGNALLKERLWELLARWRQATRDARGKGDPRRRPGGQGQALPLPELLRRYDTIEDCLFNCITISKSSLYIWTTGEIAVVVRHYDGGKKKRS